MEPGQQFFLIFLATILASRASLYVKPISSPTIRGFHMHHYMYGIVIVILALSYQNLASFAIGLGLFIDEAAFIAIHGKNHADYRSAKSLLGTAALIILIYPFREAIAALVG